MKILNIVVVDTIAMFIFLLLNIFFIKNTCANYFLEDTADIFSNDMKLTIDAGLTTIKIYCSSINPPPKLQYTSIYIPAPLDFFDSIKSVKCKFDELNEVPMTRTISNADENTFLCQYVSPSRGHVGVDNNIPYYMHKIRFRDPTSQNNMCANPTIPFLELPRAQRRLIYQHEYNLKFDSSNGVVSLNVKNTFKFNVFAAYTAFGDIADDSSQSVPELEHKDTDINELFFRLHNYPTKLYSYGKYCVAIFIKEHLPKGTMIRINVSRILLIANYDFKNSAFATHSYYVAINRDVSVSSPWIKCVDSEVIFKHHASPDLEVTNTVSLKFLNQQDVEIPGITITQPIYYPPLAQFSPTFNPETHFATLRIQTPDLLGGVILIPPGHKEVVLGMENMVGFKSPVFDIDTRLEIPSAVLIFKTDVGLDITLDKPLKNYGVVYLDRTPTSFTISHIYSLALDSLLISQLLYLPVLPLFVVRSTPIAILPDNPTIPSKYYGSQVKLPFRTTDSSQQITILIHHWTKTRSIFYPSKAEHIYANPYSLSAVDEVSSKIIVSWDNNTSKIEYLAPPLVHFTNGFRLYPWPTSVPFSIDDFRNNYNLIGLRDFTLRYNQRFDLIFHTVDIERALFTCDSIDSCTPYEKGWKVNLPTETMDNVYILFELPGYITKVGDPTFLLFSDNISFPAEKCNFTPGTIDQSTPPSLITIVCRFKILQNAIYSDLTFKIQNLQTPTYSDMQTYLNKFQTKSDIIDHISDNTNQNPTTIDTDKKYRGIRVLHDFTKQVQYKTIVIPSGTLPENTLPDSTAFIDKNILTRSISENFPPIYPVNVLEPNTNNDDNFNEFNEDIILSWDSDRKYRRLSFPTKLNSNELSSTERNIKVELVDHVFGDDRLAMVGARSPANGDVEAEKIYPDSSISNTYTLTGYEDGNSLVFLPAYIPENYKDILYQSRDENPLLYSGGPLLYMTVGTPKMSSSTPECTKCIPKTPSSLMSTSTSCSYSTCDSYNPITNPDDFFTKFNTNNLQGSTFKFIMQYQDPLSQPQPLSNQRSLSNFSSLEDQYLIADIHGALSDNPFLYGEEFKRELHKLHDSLYISSYTDYYNNLQTFSAKYGFSGIIGLYYTYLNSVTNIQSSLMTTPIFANGSHLSIPSSPIIKNTEPLDIYGVCANLVMSEDPDHPLRPKDIRSALRYVQLAVKACPLKMDRCNNTGMGFRMRPRWTNEYGIDFRDAIAISIADIDTTIKRVVVYDKKSSDRDALQPTLPLAIPLSTAFSSGTIRLHRNPGPTLCSRFSANINVCLAHRDINCIWKDERCILSFGQGDTASQISAFTERCDNISNPDICQRTPGCSYCKYKIKNTYSIEQTTIPSENCFFSESTTNDPSALTNIQCILYSNDLFPLNPFQKIDYNTISISTVNEVIIETQDAINEQLALHSLFIAIPTQETPEIVDFKNNYKYMLLGNKASYSTNSSLRISTPVVSNFNTWSIPLVNMIYTIRFQFPSLGMDKQMQNLTLYMRFSSTNPDISLDIKSYYALSILIDSTTTSSTNTQTIPQYKAQLIRVVQNQVHLLSETVVGFLPNIEYKIAFQVTESLDKSNTILGVFMNTIDNPIITSKALFSIEDSHPQRPINGLQGYTVTNSQWLKGILTILPIYSLTKEQMVESTSINNTRTVLEGNKTIKNDYPRLSFGMYTMKPKSIFGNAVDTFATIHTEINPIGEEMNDIFKYTITHDTNLQLTFTPELNINIPNIPKNVNDNIFHVMHSPSGLIPRDINLTLTYEFYSHKVTGKKIDVTAILCLEDGASTQDVCVFTPSSLLYESYIDGRLKPYTNSPNSLSNCCLIQIPSIRNNVMLQTITLSSVPTTPQITLLSERSLTLSSYKFYKREMHSYDNVYDSLSNATDETELLVMIQPVNITPYPVTFFYTVAKYQKVATTDVLDTVTLVNSNNYGYTLVNFIDLRTLLVRYTITTIGVISKKVLKTGASFTCVPHNGAPFQTESAKDFRAHYPYLEIDADEEDVNSIKQFVVSNELINHLPMLCYHSQPLIDKQDINMKVGLYLQSLNTLLKNQLPEYGCKFSSSILTCPLTGSVPYYPAQSFYIILKNESFKTPSSTTVDTPKGKRDIIVITPTQVKNTNELQFTLQNIQVYSTVTLHFSHKKTYKFLYLTGTNDVSIPFKFPDLQLQLHKQNLSQELRSTLLPLHLSHYMYGKLQDTIIPPTKSSYKVLVNTIPAMFSLDNINHINIYQRFSPDSKNDPTNNPVNSFTLKEIKLTIFNENGCSAALYNPSNPCIWGFHVPFLPPSGKLQLEISIVGNPRNDEVNIITLDLLEQYNIDYSIDSIDPADIIADKTTDVVINGKNFPPSIVLDSNIIEFTITATKRTLANGLQPVDISIGKRHLITNKDGYISIDNNGICQTSTDKFTHFQLVGAIEYLPGFNLDMFSTFFLEILPSQMTLALLSEVYTAHNTNLITFSTSSDSKIQIHAIPFDAVTYGVEHNLLKVINAGNSSDLQMLSSRILSQNIFYFDRPGFSIIHAFGISPPDNFKPIDENADILNIKKQFGYFDLRRRRNCKALPRHHLLQYMQDIMSGKLSLDPALLDYTQKIELIFPRMVKSSLTLSYLLPQFSSLTPIENVSVADSNFSVNVEHSGIIVEPYSPISITSINLLDGKPLAIQQYQFLLSSKVLIFKASHLLALSSYRIIIKYGSSVRLHTVIRTSDGTISFGECNKNIPTVGKYVKLGDILALSSPHIYPKTRFRSSWLLNTSYTRTYIHPTFCLQYTLNNEKEKTLSPCQIGNKDLQLSHIFLGGGKSRLATTGMNIRLQLNYDITSSENFIPAIGTEYSFLAPVIHTIYLSRESTLTPTSSKFNLNSMTTADYLFFKKATAQSFIPKFYEDDISPSTSCDAPIDDGVLHNMEIEITTAYNYHKEDSCDGSCILPLSYKVKTILLLGTNFGSHSVDSSDDPVTVELYHDTGAKIQLYNCHVVYDHISIECILTHDRDDSTFTKYGFGDNWKIRIITHPSRQLHTQVSSYKDVNAPILFSFVAPSMEIYIRHIPTNMIYSYDDFLQRNQIEEDILNNNMNLLHNTYISPDFNYITPAMTSLEYNDQIYDGDYTPLEHYYSHGPVSPFQPSLSNNSDIYEVYMSLDIIPQIDARDPQYANAYGQGGSRQIPFYIDEPTYVLEFNDNSPISIQGAFDTNISTHFLPSSGPLKSIQTLRKEHADRVVVFEDDSTILDTSNQHEQSKKQTANNFLIRLSFSNLHRLKALTIISKLSALSAKEAPIIRPVINYFKQNIISCVNTSCKYYYYNQENYGSNDRLSKCIFFVAFPLSQLPNIPYQEVSRVNMVGIDGEHVTLIESNVSYYTDSPSEPYYVTFIINDNTLYTGNPYIIRPCFSANLTEEGKQAAICAALPAYLHTFANESINLDDNDDNVNSSVLKTNYLQYLIKDLGKSTYSPFAYFTKHTNGLVALQQTISEQEMKLLKPITTIQDQDELIGENDIPQNRNLSSMESYSQKQLNLMKPTPFDILTLEILKSIEKQEIENRKNTRNGISTNNQGLKEDDGFNVSSDVIEEDNSSSYSHLQETKYDATISDINVRVYYKEIDTPTSDYHYRACPSRTFLRRDTINTASQSAYSTASSGLPSFQSTNIGMNDITKLVSGSTLPWLFSAPKTLILDSNTLKTSQKDIFSSPNPNENTASHHQCYFNHQDPDFMNDITKNDKFLVITISGTNLLQRIPINSNASFDTVSHSSLGTSLNMLYPVVTVGEYVCTPCNFDLIDGKLGSFCEIIRSTTHSKDPSSPTFDSNTFYSETTRNKIYCVVNMEVIVQNYRASIGKRSLYPTNMSIFIHPPPITSITKNASRSVLLDHQLSLFGCNAGWYISPYDLYCRPCPSGYYSRSTSSYTCIPCPQGTYNDFSGASKCKPCKTSLISGMKHCISPINIDTSQLLQSNSLQSTIASLPNSSTDSATNVTNIANAANIANVENPNSDTIYCNSGYYYETQVNSGKYQQCVACPKNTYSSASQYHHYSCTPCELGTFSTSGSSLCTPCPKGTATLQTGINFFHDPIYECSVCPKSYFAPSIGMASCLPCKEGYQSNENYTECIACEPGKYRASYMDECVSCEAGTYSPTSGASECIECDKKLGFYASGKNNVSCQICLPPNKIINSSTCIFSIQDTCLVGEYYDDTKEIDKCTQSSPGFYSNIPYSTKQTPCPDNTYMVTNGASSCEPCPNNTFSTSNSHGTTGCEPCESGKYSTIQNGVNTGCISCSPGYYASAIGCMQCLPGTFGIINTNFMGECKDCGEGEYSSTSGSLRCEKCPYGMEPTADKSSCQKCPVGSILGDGICKICKDDDPDCLNCNKIGYDSNCKLCAPGYYSIKIGDQYECQECGENYFSSMPGSLQCSPCLLGYYSKTTSTSCTPCSAGEYRGRDESDPSMILRKCEKCPPGTYSDPGSSECVNCPAGTYQPLSGQPSCEKCKAGTFSAVNASNPRILQCNVCDRGTYSGVGFGKCFPCLDGYYSSEPGSEQCLKCIPGTTSDEAYIDLYVKSIKAGRPLNPCYDCDLGKYSIAGSVCTLCPPGKFAKREYISIDKNIQYYFSCEKDPSSCPEGYWINKCVDCDAGEYNNIFAAKQCQQCPIGTAQESSGSSQCQTCRGSKYSDIVGAKTCKSCLDMKVSSENSSYCVCDVGYYSDTYEVIPSPVISLYNTTLNDLDRSVVVGNTASDIQRIRNKVVTIINDDGILDVLGILGTLRTPATPDNWTKVFCKPCPAGAKCDASNLGAYEMGIKEGFWRTDTKSLEYHSCMTSSSCLEVPERSTIGYQCNSGFMSPLCASCLPSYYMNNLQCMKCPARSTTQIQVISVLILVFVVVLLIIIGIGFADRALPKSTQAYLLYIHNVIQSKLEKKKLGYYDDVIGGNKDGDNSIKDETNDINNITLFNWRVMGTSSIRYLAKKLDVIQDQNLKTGLSSELEMCNLDNSPPIQRNPLLQSTEVKSNANDGKSDPTLQGAYARALGAEKGWGLSELELIGYDEYNIKGGSMILSAASTSITRADEIIAGIHKQRFIRPSMLFRIHIFFLFLQFGYLVTSMIDIPWPDTIRSSFRLFHIISFNIFEWTSAACLFPFQTNPDISTSTYYHIFWITMATPPFMMIISFLFYTVPLFVYAKTLPSVLQNITSIIFCCGYLQRRGERYRHTEATRRAEHRQKYNLMLAEGKSTEEELNIFKTPDEVDEKTRITIENTIIWAQTSKVCFFIMCILFARVIHVAASLFHCKDVGKTGSFMLNYFADECYVDRWYDHVVYSIIFLVFYGLGFPILCFYLLYSKRTQLASPLTTLRFGALYEGYLSSRWWFSMINFLFMAIIAVAMPLLKPEYQLSITAILITVYIISILMFNPYFRKGDDRLHLFVSAAIFLIAYAGHCFQFYIKFAASISAGSGRDVSISTRIAIVCLIIYIIALNVLYFFGQVYTVIRQNRKISRREKDSFGESQVDKLSLIIYSGQAKQSKKNAKSRNEDSLNRDYRNKNSGLSTIQADQAQISIRARTEAATKVSIFQKQEGGDVNTHDIEMTQSPIHVYTLSPKDQYNHDEDSNEAETTEQFDNIPPPPISSNRRRNAIPFGSPPLAATKDKLGDKTIEEIANELLLPPPPPPPPSRARRLNTVMSPNSSIIPHSSQAQQLSGSTNKDQESVNSSPPSRDDYQNRSTMDRNRRRHAALTRPKK